MTSPHDRPLFEDPHYVQGQLDSVKQLVLALADLLVGPEDFVESAMQRLESARVAVLASQAHDTRLLAIDHCEAWLKVVAGGRSR